MEIGLMASLTYVSMHTWASSVDVFDMVQSHGSYSKSLACYSEGMTKWMLAAGLSLLRISVQNDLFTSRGCFENHPSGIAFDSEFIYSWYIHMDFCTTSGSWSFFFFFLQLPIGR